MKEYIKMVSVLTAIATVCGFFLAALNKGTEKRIEEQELFYVKAPAVNRVLETSTNDLIQDRKEITINDRKHVVFIGKKNDEPWAISFESSSPGFGGDIGVMIGYDLKNDTLTGIGILVHKETPGLGARVSELSFTNNFKDKSISDKFTIKKDGGAVDAVSGATISSRGV